MNIPDRIYWQPSCCRGCFCLLNSAPLHRRLALSLDNTFSRLQKRRRFSIRIYFFFLLGNWCIGTVEEKNAFLLCSEQRTTVYFPIRFSIRFFSRRAIIIVKLSIEKIAYLKGAATETVIKTIESPSIKLATLGTSLATQLPWSQFEFAPTVRFHWKQAKVARGENIDGHIAPAFSSIYQQTVTRSPVLRSLGHVRRNLWRSYKDAL